VYLQINTVKYNADWEIIIFMRIYKQFDPSLSLICYFSFIFGLLRISIGLLVFGFVANEYQWRAIWLLSTIRNIRSAIWWVIPKVILNYSRLPSWLNIYACLQWVEVLLWLSVFVLCSYDWVMQKWTVSNLISNRFIKPKAHLFV